MSAIVRRWLVVIFALFLIAAAPTPQASPPVFTGAPGVRMVLDAHPLGIDPDGRARWLVHAGFRDSTNHSTDLIAGGDVEYAASRGMVQWQTRIRFNGPSAIVTTTDEGPIQLRVTVVAPSGIAPAEIATDPRTWHVQRVVAAVLGPHLVQIGWFPEQTRAVNVLRASADGPWEKIATVMPPSSTYRDESVTPGQHYRYKALGASFALATPAELPTASLSVFGGKSMWLAFSPSPRDPDSYQRLDPDAIATQAVRAGLRSIALRTTYGELWQVSDAARPTIDRLIDRLSASGITVLAWVVPREPTFLDLQQIVRSAAYRTAAGNGFAGIALDLERGGAFLGDGEVGKAAIVEEADLVRSALGPAYLLMGTVEDPALERLDNRSYPYQAVAAKMQAIQPMTYWRALSAARTPAEVRSLVVLSIVRVRREAGRAVPVNLGGQTAQLDSSGAPTPPELNAALGAAQAAGAIGVTFFDWTGTTPADWDAIAAYRW